MQRFFAVMLADAGRLKHSAATVNVGNEKMFFYREAMHANTPDEHVCMHFLKPVLGQITGFVAAGAILQSAVVRQFRPRLWRKTLPAASTIRNKSCFQ